MKITPSPYRTNCSPGFQWLPDRHDEDEVIIASAVFDMHADNYQRFDLEMVAGTISLTAGLIFYFIFIYQMRNEYIFKSQFGGAKLFFIEKNKPNQKQFDNFFISLQQAI